MEAIVAIAEAVKRHWLSQGLKIHPVRLEELAVLQRTLSGSIQAEYGAFLATAGLPDDEDKSGIRFWQPHEIRVMRSAIRDTAVAVPANERLAVIADYFQESWSYAIWLSGPLTGKVSVVPSVPSGWVAPAIGTLSEFLVAYLAGDPRVYSY